MRTVNGAPENDRCRHDFLLVALAVMIDTSFNLVLALQRHYLVPRTNLDEIGERPRNEGEAQLHKSFVGHAVLDGDPLVTGIVNPGSIVVADPRSVVINPETDAARCCVEFSVGAVNGELAG